MKQYQTDKIRNIALVSHNGAGKTMLVERLLFDTKVTTRLGSVQNQTAAMDFEEEEMERNSSISTAIAAIEWQGTKFNLLDTPGYVDFVGEVNSALYVADSAVVLVEAASGVEVGTELVWQYTKDMPRILLINKMDRENVRTRRVKESITNNLDLASGTQLVDAQIPVGEGVTFKGVIDLLTMKAYLDDSGEPSDIPAGMADEAEEARMVLVEVAAEGDDALLDKYFEEFDLSPEDTVKGLRAAIQAGSAIPIFYAAPQTGLAVTPLMNALVNLMPAPNEHTYTVTNADGNEAEHPVSNESPLTVFIFKTREDPYGKLSYLRVFGGSLSSDSRVWDATQETEVRIGTLNVLRGKDQLSVGGLSAGDIGVVVKLGDAATNGTLAMRSESLTMAAIKQPNAIVALAIEPASQSDVAKLSASLNRLVGEDPTLRWRNEQATHQTILSGMGNVHLNMAVKKAKSKFGVNLNTSLPIIPYRETITRTGDAEYTHKKQTGGAGQYARVFIRVETMDNDDAEFEFKSEIFGGSISGPFVSAVEKGCRAALADGIMAGFPITGVRAVVYDGKEHPVDSKEIAFQTAGREGFRRAARKANPVLLEPIFELAVTIPNDNMGDIIGDLNTRRARVLGMDQVGSKAIVKAEIPLAEAQSYSADLRSMTQGRGVFSLAFLHYGRVPSHLQDKIIEARNARENE